MGPQAVTASSLKQERALKKKKMRKRLMIGGGVLVFLYIVYLLFVPYKGEMTYGVCKTFLELQVPYPEHLRLSSVDDMGALVRIWFTQVDSFGQYRLEALSCTYRAADAADEKKYGGPLPFLLDKASINRREIDEATIEKFNYSLSSIVQSNPDLTLPDPLPDSLEKLQMDASKFIKPIF